MKIKDQFCNKFNLAGVVDVIIQFKDVIFDILIIKIP